MMCPICKDLKKIDEVINVYELYGSKSGYFFAIPEMIINYCPTCGKEIKHHDQRTILLHELSKTR